MTTKIIRDPVMAITEVREEVLIRYSDQTDELLQSFASEAYKVISQKCLEVYRVLPPREAFTASLGDGDVPFTRAVILRLTGTPSSGGVELLGGPWDGVIMAIPDDLGHIRFQEQVSQVPVFTLQLLEPRTVQTQEVNYRRVGVSTLTWRQVFEVQS